MKIHVFGDSFADPDFNTKNHSWAWPVQLAERYQVKNYALAQTGCDWSVQQLLNVPDVETVVFVCGYSNRYHHMKTSELKKCTPLFTDDWLQRQYVNTVATVKEVCPRAIVFMVDQNYASYYIKDTDNFVVHPTPLLDLYEQDNVSYNVLDWEPQGWRDRRPNHLQQPGHQHILTAIEDFVCKQQ